MSWFTIVYYALKDTPSWWIYIARISLKKRWCLCLRMHKENVLLLRGILGWKMDTENVQGDGREIVPKNKDFNSRKQNAAAIGYKAASFWRTVISYCLNRSSWFLIQGMDFIEFRNLGSAPLISWSCTILKSQQLFQCPVMVDKSIFSHRRILSYFRFLCCTSHCRLCCPCLPFRAFCIFRLGAPCPQILALVHYLP